MARQYDENFAEFWEVYRPLNKNCKAEAEDKFLKKCEEWCKREGKQPEDFKKHLIHQIDLIKHHNKLIERTGKQAPFWPHARTWIFQERYEDEFEQSASELNEQSRFNKKSCQCGKPATILDKCDGCYSVANPHRYDDNLRAKARQQINELPRNEGESWRQWYVRARKHFKLDQVFNRPKERLIKPLNHEEWQERFKTGE